ncbi:MAG: beta-lactamase hydrolase domain-containing protein [Nevskiales bacterium]
MTPHVWIDVPNARFPVEGVCTGGKPRPEDLRQARNSGVKTVISLCSPSECDNYDEGALVTALGMHYLNIPVAGPADLTLAKARALAEALLEMHDGPVLVHCASGNRVGALFAIKARLIDDLTTEQSIAVGRAAGLKTLESEVRCVLAQR